MVSIGVNNLSIRNPKKVRSEYLDRPKLVDSNIIMIRACCELAKFGFINIRRLIIPAILC